MRLALITDGFGRGGGTAGYVEGLATGLLARGHHVTVYASRGRPVEGVDLRLLPAFGRGVLGMGLRSWTTWRLPLRGFDHVVGLGRTLGHDVYRAGGGAHAAWLQARAELGGRWIAPWDRAEVALDAWANRSARVVIANSERAAADLRAHYGLNDVRVIRNGVDLRRFVPSPDERQRCRARWGVPAEGRVALFLAHGFRRKGLAVALAAFAQVAGPADRLVIVGRDAHPQPWRALAQRLVGDRALFLGATDRPEGVYPGADAVLSPTWYDAAANTTLEAMACGVPVVTSGRDGNAEIVGPGAVVDHPLHVEGFAAALRDTWEDPRRGPAARALAEGWPDSRNHREVEALLGDLPR